MDGKVHNVPFDVWIEFDIVIDVPFAESYPEIVMRITAKKRTHTINFLSSIDVLIKKCYYFRIKLLVIYDLMQ